MNLHSTSYRDPTSSPYLCKTELVHALCDAPLCSLHVLRFFGSFEQQSLFVLNRHTTLKAEVNLEHTEQVDYIYILKKTKKTKTKEERKKKKKACLVS